MKRALVDVNVWLGLLVRQHRHHRLALKWYDSLSWSEAGMCRFVQLSLIRILGNRSVMSEHAVAAGTAWSLIEELAEDERVEFVPEPADLDRSLPALLRDRVPTGKLVNDAYLAAFAMCASRHLVTLDAGYRQFRGLDLEILGSTV